MNKEDSKQHATVEATINNPILKGFYPDPSIIKVKSDYYLVNSSFAYFPGLPLFHSTDLVNWKQIGHAMDRPEQLNLDGLGVSRGLFAPGISYHNDRFYIVCTLIDNGNNFIIHAKNPAGPWSDPVFIPQLDGGIDPSLFFDDDGKCYLIYNSVPPDNKGDYDGHRTLRLYQFDINNNKVIGEEHIVVNKGAKLEDNPIWIEGPHILKRNGYYYLIAAEGGTNYDHSEVVFRSKSVLGPYESYTNNPILTQRHLDPKRPNPITTTGHADFVKDDLGNWWSVFLGCRPYPENQYNTGRETFMAPVSWENDWPKIDLGGDIVKSKYTIEIKNPLDTTIDSNYLRNYFYDDFKSEKLNYKYAFLRTPRNSWYNIDTTNAGHLIIDTRPESASELVNPSFIGHRQEHLKGEVVTKLEFSTDKPNEKAGLLIFQNENHFYFLAKSFQNGNPVVQLLKSDASGLIELASVPIKNPENATYLKVEADFGNYNFYYSDDGKTYSSVAKNIEAKFLSTEVAGGFVGAFYAMYTTSLGQRSTNKASFDWFQNTNLDEEN
ncbi:glycoside hydrolase family 43 protein [Gelidibacter salicanalis]|uniref:Glycoside hydrolase family 43 protein n=1 Tax=Gelidibacter salicanalis TaxID=291193 RepID=A0A934NKH9_9FLAO|nr:glycoside hydrolase family 43 protein [Gelidibacter salicanalis]MBJ7880682.1 glycoside hydrolase family 43 protein [Gelidibacter salicanalis]